MLDKDMDRTSTLSLDVKRTDTPTSHLRRTYEAQRTLFQAQPQGAQRFLGSQSLALARAILQDAGQVKFSLPDQVACDGGTPGELKSIPVDRREQKIGGLAWRMTHASLLEALKERLTALETAQEQGLATGASLIRYTTAVTMVRSILPAGRSVRYRSDPGEEIPSEPVLDDGNEGKRATASDEDEANQGADHLGAPYVPAARRFYLPQWVAFDEHGKLLVNTINDARAHIASMQEFLAVLRTAASLAPYILADAEYQQKRYGMMGQLLNQGRMLARFETDEIIRFIQQRVNSQSLNRGLSLSLPYFDDQDMELKNLDFVVIPAGRIMFVPAFLVMAITAEAVKVAHNDWMSSSTRQHLLAELKSLEQAFDTGK
jgi:hypothetical protein